LQGCLDGNHLEPTEANAKEKRKGWINIHVPPPSRTGLFRITMAGRLRESGYAPCTAGLFKLISEVGEMEIELNAMKTTSKKHKKNQVNEAYD
jgi:hypothetical protein